MATINNPTKNDAPQSTKNGHNTPSPLDFTGSGKGYTQPIAVSDVVVILGQQSYYVGSLPEIETTASEATKGALQTRFQSLHIASEYDKKISGYKNSEIFTPGYILAKARTEASISGDLLLRVRETLLQPAIKKFLGVEQETKSLNLVIKNDDFRAALRENRIIMALQSKESIPAKNDFVRMLHKEGDDFGLAVCLSEAPYITGLDEGFRITMIAQLSRERDPVRCADQKELRAMIEVGETAWAVAMTHVLWSSGIAPAYQAPSATSIIASNLPDVNNLVADLVTYQNSKRHQDDLAMTPTNYA